MSFLLHVVNQSSTGFEFHFTVQAMQTKELSINTYLIDNESRETNFLENYAQARGEHRFLLYRVGQKGLLIAPSL
mgnify:CR=1 FL=1